MQRVHNLLSVRTSHGRVLFRYFVTTLSVNLIHRASVARDTLNEYTETPTACNRREYVWYVLRSLSGWNSECPIFDRTYYRWRLSPTRLSTLSSIHPTQLHQARHVANYQEGDTRLQINLGRSYELNRIHSSLLFTSRTQQKWGKAFPPLPTRAHH